MKAPLFPLALAFFSLAMLTGCGGALDTRPMAAGDADRVLTGQLEANDSGPLPSDTVVVVRVIDPERTGEKPPQAVIGEPQAVPVRATLPPKVLGEQEIKNPGAFPISFRVEYTAIDEQLRAGLIVEARVSYGGKVRYFNVNSSAVSLTNYTDPHVITVNRL